MNLQNFTIEVVTNDLTTSWPGTLEDVQYEMKWGELTNRRIESKEKLDACEDLEDYLLEAMFLEMCRHAWRAAKEADTLVIDRKLASEVLNCRHENWEEHYHGAKCLDCGHEF
jgi:hypothetical protein